MEALQHKKNRLTLQLQLQAKVGRAPPAGQSGAGHPLGDRRANYER